MVVLKAKHDVFKGGVYYPADEHIQVTEDFAKYLMKGGSFQEISRDTPKRSTRKKTEEDSDE